MAARRKKLRRPAKKKPARRAASLDDLLPDTPAQPVEAKLERAPVPATRGSYVVRVAELRRMAGIDFIRDPDGNTIDHWWAREDRPYHKAVKQKTFQEWAREDNWINRREQFWLEVEYKVLEDAKHKILVQKLREIDEVTVISDAMQEYLRPLRDPLTGDVKRYPEYDNEGKPHPLAGLPVFPLELPPMDKFAKSWIDVNKLLMTKRGEATSRSETLQSEQTRVIAGGLDPTTSGVSFSREDIRRLAAYALKMKQPELQGENPLDDVIDIDEVEEPLEEAEEDEDDV